MKLACKDVTFVILIRQDSIQRLENILIVTQLLNKYLDTRIHVWEADSKNNHLVKTLLGRNVEYQYIEDSDPVLHRTRYLNEMITACDTPYVSIWDTDIVPDKNAIQECLDSLRQDKAFVSSPYNGHCLDVPELIKNLFLKKKDVRILYRHANKMDYLYPQILTGGAIFLNRQKFIEAGMENEKHYGWGNEDYDRSVRFTILNYPMHRVSVPLFHLWHPRGKNSTYFSDHFKKVSVHELMQLHNESDLLKTPSLQLLKYGK